MQKAIVCLILISIFILSEDIFALQNSCQHGIIIKFIPQSKVEIDDDINVIEIESAGASLAPNDMVNTRSVPINLNRHETSGYLGKITAELDKDYGFGMNFTASCNNSTKSEREWKKLDTSASNILSSIKNGRNTQNSISYGLTIPNLQVMPNDKMITVILTVTDDENLYNEELLSREFYSYEEFYESIRINHQNSPSSLTLQ